MNLKDKKYFYFTQNSLTTFKNCPFRFKKRYMDNIKWQEEENEDNIERIEFGTNFHKIAQRYFMKIPVYEESFSSDSDLFLAYKNLVECFPLDDNFKYYPEYTIRYADSQDIRLEANIDLIIDKGDVVEIWDWKTNAKIGSKKYATSLQTKIYMLVLKKCCKDIFNKDFNNIKMIYFSPENKANIEEITYSDELYKKDEKNITDLVKKVYNFNWDEFDKTKFLKQCKFCEFNLFCNNSKENTTYEFAKLNWDDISELY